MEQLKQLIKNLRSSFIFRCLFLAFILVCCSAGYQQVASASIALDSTFALKAGNFAPGELEVHYEKHGYQFGQITKEQYLQGAQALLDAAPTEDVLEKIRPDGDVEHFRVSTGEFAVMTRRGRIRTYFKTNYGYWLWRQ